MIRDASLGEFGVKGYDFGLMMLCHLALGEDPRVGCRLIHVEHLVASGDSLHVLVSLRPVHVVYVV